MRELPLSGKKGAGKAVIVDCDDYALVAQWSWSLYDYHGVEYAQASVNGKCGVMMHRFLMGAPPADGLMVDHKNGNGLDNRRDNLRWATPQQNQWNSKAVRGSSKYKGVSWAYRCPIRPWVAQIRVGKKIVHLGQYATEEEAAAAYDGAARRLRGQYARVNFPEPTSE